MKHCRGCRQKKELIHFWKADGEIFIRCSECRSLPRVCTKCKEVKDYSEFHFSKNSSGNYGYQTRCKTCKSSDKDRNREQQLKIKYSMTLDDYDKFLASQGGLCAICQKPELVNNRRLAVDHDHETGEVRGLLCSRCNMGLGKFQDDPDLIETAARYLRESRTA